MIAVMPLLYRMWVSLVRVWVNQEFARTLTHRPGLALLLVAAFAAYGLLVAGVVFCARDYLHAKSFRVLLWICAGVSLVLSADYWFTKIIPSIALLPAALWSAGERAGI